jgi:hypothetical protein
MVAATAIDRVSTNPDSIRNGLPVLWADLPVRQLLPG